MKSRRRFFRDLGALLCVVALLRVPLHAEPAAELKPFDARSLGRIRESNQGRPFILAFWSLNCAPCKEEMAVLRTMHARYPELTIVLVGTDSLEQRPAVLRFLAQQKWGRIEHWSFADEFEERIRYGVDRAWRGELPQAYLFDAEHRATRRTGPLDITFLDTWCRSVSRGK